MVVCALVSFNLAELAREHGEVPQALDNGVHKAVVLTVVLEPQRPILIAHEHRLH